jgi:hypothetical protein
MTTEIIKSFNSIVESFLSQMSSVVGTSYYTYFKRVIKVNSLIAIENSVQYLIPFKDKIFNKNESYFYNEENYLDTINKTPISSKYSGDSILSEIFRLKNIYGDLNQESRENVWSILQALVQLTIEYCEAKGITIN